MSNMIKKADVMDAAAAAAKTGLSPETIRGACNRGEIAGAWKPSKVSRGWLMLREDVEAWRKSRRKYERKDA